MNIRRLDHLVITTGDLEKCLHFYVDILGMEPDMENGRCAVRFGDQKINIHRRAGEFLPAARNVTCGSQDICLVAEGPVEHVRAELAAKGWPMELGVVRRAGACGPMDSIYLRDPDGNLVEIGVYTKI